MAAFREEGAPVIVRGEGAYLYDDEGRRYLDAISSLWCNLHGHRHPRLDAALAAQAGRVAHSTLLGLGSEAPRALARELLRWTPEGLARVFYSDSGASAVEVALKIAFQYHRVKENPEPKRTRFVALRNSYHGDTLGAVAVGGIPVFHEIFRPILAHDVVDFVEADEGAASLRSHLAARGDEIAAVVYEPSVQGAAGIRLLPDGFARDAADAARAAGALAIADEVATGFGRTGPMFATSDAPPDILCLGKGITAGYLPLAATLTTDRVHDAFLGRWEDSKHLFHGHTYTGNALASAVGLSSLGIFREEKTLERIGLLSEAASRALASLRATVGPHIGEIRQRGLMIGIDVVDRGRPFPVERRTGHRVILEARRRGAILRPLGDTIVWMPPYCVSEGEIMRLGEITAESIGVVVR